MRDVSSYTRQWHQIENSKILLIQVNSHNGTVSVGPSRNSWGKLLDENGIISEERNVSVCLQSDY